MEYCYFVFEVSGGFCGIAWNDVGIARFQLPSPGAEATERKLLHRLPSAQRDTPPPWVLGAIEATKQYFDGARIDFSGFALDLDGQPPFFQQIYTLTRRVGWGQTTTYGALAKELGAGPEAARAVGQAMARNPIPLLIPCHRVLAAGGKVGGFSAPGGTHSKVHMLELEGVRVGPAPSPQQSLGF